MFLKHPKIKAAFLDRLKEKDLWPTPMPQPNAKNVFGFAHLLSAQDFAQRGPLEIVLAGDKLATTAEALIDRGVA